MKRYLVTGVAGFIGANVAAALLRAGHEVVGVDNINDYYDPLLKRYRLVPLLAEPHFSFVETDLADARATQALFADRPFHVVIHLAAQAGVRYSLQNPRCLRAKQSGWFSACDRRLLRASARALGLCLIEFGLRQQRP